MTLRKACVAGLRIKRRTFLIGPESKDPLPLSTRAHGGTTHGPVWMDTFFTSNLQNHKTLKILLFLSVDLFSQHPTEVLNLSHPAFLDFTITCLASMCSGWLCTCVPVTVGGATCCGFALETKATYGTKKYCRSTALTTFR